MPRDSVVYVVQEPLRWDHRQQKMVKVFDVSDAERFGSLDYLLTPNASPWRNEGIIRELHEKLRFYTRDDFLLLIGNPALIGMVTSIAPQYSDGVYKMLQWSGKDDQYRSVSVDVRKPK